MKTEELAKSKDRQRNYIADYENLKTQLKELLSKNEDLESSLNSKDFQIESLSKELIDAKNDIKNLKNEFLLIEQKAISSGKIQEENRTRQNLLELQRSKLEDENRDLHSQINESSMELEQVKTELDRAKIEISNLKQGISQVDNNNEVALQKTCRILKEGLEIYNEELIPILENDKSIFGIELSRFSFPRILTSDPSGGIVRWADSFRNFMEVFRKCIRGNMAGDITRIKEREHKLSIENEKLQNELRNLKKELSDAISQYVYY